MPYIVVALLEEDEASCLHQKDFVLAFDSIKFVDDVFTRNIRRRHDLYYSIPFYII